MFGGYSGSILRVDLNQESIVLEHLDEALAKKYVGGSGLAAKILWDETTKDTDPLSPENLLIFMTGPLTGTIAPSSSRFVTCAISPLTGIWGESHAGGTWGYELKHAGFDGVIVMGRAERPTYIWIKDGEVDIGNARHIWGKDTFAATNLVRNETDERASIVTIGPAGERLVKIASIMTEGEIARAAARCGLGAVMGSKNLKAVAVRGTTSPHVVNEEALREDMESLLPRLSQHLSDDGSGFHDLRELRRLDGAAFSATGNYPVRNWSQGAFTGFHDKENNFTAHLSRKTRVCKTCMSGCSHCYVTDDGKPLFFEATGPLGSNCLIDDFDAMVEALDTCNRLGIDCISTGGVIGFAMECYEKGLISKHDAEGMDLRWGNSKAMLELVRKIGLREGLGELLGEGVRRAAQQIGGRASEYAIHVKGMEFPAHSPKAHAAVAIEYATSNRGAHHKEGSSDWLEKKINAPDLGYDTRLNRFETKGKGEACSKMQDFLGMVNSLVCCIFLFSTHGIQASDFTRWLNYATGYGFDTIEFMKTGERIYNLKRLFNVRRGISRKDDMLPPRILVHKFNEGGAQYLPFLGEMLNEYYNCRGWNEEGIPTRETLKKLDLLELTEKENLIPPACD